MLAPGNTTTVVDSQVVQCAVHVAVNHFPRSAPLVVSTARCDFPAVTTLLITLLSREILWAVENVCGAKNRGQGVPLFTPKPSSYILVIPTRLGWHDDFMEQVFMLRERANWNAKASFLVLLLGDGVNEQSADSVLSELWRHLVANAVVIVSKPAPEVALLARFPITQPDGESTVIARWRHGRLYATHPLFEPPVALGRLENFTLKALTFHWPPYAILADDSFRSVWTGIEVELLRAVSRAMGFRLLEEVILDGNWPHLMRRLNAGTVDVSFGGFIPYSERYLWFDASASYLPDSTRWFVTPPRPLTVLECVFQVFRPRVWVLIFAIYIIIVALEVAFAKSRALDTSQYQSWTAVALDSWRLLVDTSLHTLPITTRVRLLVAAWILGCMHINQAFRSNLTSSLSRSQHEVSPRDLQQLVSSGLPLAATTLTLTRLYGGEAEPPASVRAVLRSARPCADPPTCVALVRRLYRHRHALAISDNYARFASRDVHLIPTDEIVISYYNVMFFRRGHPLQDAISHHMLMAVQTGLVQHWEAVVRLQYVGEREDAASEDSAEHNLGLVDIGFVFGALLLGCVLAVVCFAAECAVGSRRSGRRQAAQADRKHHVTAFRSAVWVGHPAAQRGGLAAGTAARRRASGTRCRRIVPRSHKHFE